MNSNCFVENSYMQFIETLRCIENDNHHTRRSWLLNSKDLAPTGSDGAFIQQRQQNAQIIKKEHEGTWENHCSKKNSDGFRSIYTENVKDSTAKKSHNSPNHQERPSGSQERPSESQPVI